MLDVILVGTAVVFFGLCLAYTRACDRLWREKHRWSSIMPWAVPWPCSSPSTSPTLSFAPNAS